MKKLHRYVFLLFALVSVAMVAWAIVAGMSAPDSAKIANSTPLVQQFDAEGNAVNTEDDQPVPVTTTSEGIRALGIIFANQLEEGILTESAIEEEKVKRTQTIEVIIPEYEQKVENAREEALAAQATIEELKQVKRLSGAQKKQLANAETIDANFKALNDTLAQYRENVVIMQENIDASIRANAQAKADAENMVALATAVNWNLIWFYFMIVFAICFIVFAAVWDMLLNTGGLKKTAFALLIVAGVIGLAYFIASGNGWNEGHTLKDAAGYDLGIGTDMATRTVFGPFEYMMADTSIIVTYITIAGAALAAVFSAIRGIFKS